MRTIGDWVQGGVMDLAFLAPRADHDSSPHATRMVIGEQAAGRRAFIIGVRTDHKQPHVRLTTTIGDARSLHVPSSLGVPAAATPSYRLHPSTWIVAVTRGTWPTTRVVCPCPVRSSAIFTSPGPRRWMVPSPRPISASPDRVMMYCRRGALCQSLKWPGAVERNTTPLAPWSAVNSGCDAKSSSSMCDSPSSPEYKRKIPMQDSPQVGCGRATKVGHRV